MQFKKQEIDHSFGTTVYTHVGHSHDRDMDNFCPIFMHDNYEKQTNKIEQASAILDPKGLMAGDGETVSRPFLDGLEGARNNRAKKAETGAN